MDRDILKTISFSLLLVLLSLSFATWKESFSSFKESAKVIRFSMSAYWSLISKASACSALLVVVAVVVVVVVGGGGGGEVG